MHKPESQNKVLIECLEYLVARGPPYKFEERDYEVVRRYDNYSIETETNLQNICTALEELPEVRLTITRTRRILPTDLLAEYIIRMLDYEGFTGSEDND